MLAIRLALDPRFEKVSNSGSSWCVAHAGGAEFVQELDHSNLSSDQDFQKIKIPIYLSSVPVFFSFSSFTLYQSVCLSVCTLI
jgi:hypothetical protein